MRVFSAAGAGEEMMKKLLPTNNDRRTYYPSTFLNERWCARGGRWHKQINRSYLEEEISKLLSTQLATVMKVLLKEILLSVFVHPTTRTYDRVSTIPITLSSRLIRQT